MYFVCSVKHVMSAAAVCINNLKGCANGHGVSALNCPARHKSQAVWGAVLVTAMPYHPTITSISLHHSFCQRTALFLAYYKLTVQQSDVKRRFATTNTTHQALGWPMPCGNGVSRVLHVSRHVSRA